MLKRNSLIEQLKDSDLSYALTSGWNECLESDHEILITTADIDQGFMIKKYHFAVLTEKDIYGFKRRLKERKQLRDPEAIIQNLKDLRPGSLIVHRDYGIGIYDGLNKMKIDDIDYEFIKIIYGVFVYLYWFVYFKKILFVNYIIIISNCHSYRFKC